MEDPFEKPRQLSQTKKIPSANTEAMNCLLQTVENKRKKISKIQRLKKRMANMMLDHFGRQAENEKFIDEWIDLVDFEKRTVEDLEKTLLTQLIRLLPTLPSELKQAESQCNSLFRCYRNELEIKDEVLEQLRVKTKQEKARRIEAEKQLKAMQEKLQAWMTSDITEKKPFAVASSEGLFHHTRTINQNHLNNEQQNGVHNLFLSHSPTS